MIICPSEATCLHADFCLVSQHCENPVKLLVYYKADNTNISSQLNLFAHAIPEKLLILESNNNHLLTHFLYFYSVPIILVSVTLNMFPFVKEGNGYDSEREN